MPNGSSISDADFRRLNESFSVLDADFATFAREIGAEYIRNYHGGPSRRLDYSGPDGVRRSIWFSARIGSFKAQGGSSDAEYARALMAWKDYEEGRRTWHRKLDVQPRLPGKAELHSVLENMYQALNAVTEDDLV